jgi:SMI1-KNR4 cell-wall
VEREEFTDLVERVKAERPTWFRLPPDTPPDEEQLRAVEKELGARLPEDYAWFLREFGGGDFVFLRLLSADARSDLLITVFPVEDGEAQDRVLFFDHETGEVSPSEPDFLTFVSRKAFGDFPQ